jgi:enoyl-CoA hydratase/carnithine racemase
VFCAGADIGALAELRRGGGDPATEAELALAAFGKPTVAAIRGDCVGGGVQLAAACDLRVATEGARFGVTPARLGIVYPVAAIARLVHLIGPAHTKRLLFTADLVDAATAHRFGLIEAPVPAADFDDRVGALATTLATRSQLTLRASKDIVDTIVREGLDAARERYRSWRAESEASGEAAEGIAAFVERRPPVFRWS